MSRNFTINNHPSHFIPQPSSLIPPSPRLRRAGLHPSSAKASAGRPSSLLIHQSMVCSEGFSQSYLLRNDSRFLSLVLVLASWFLHLVYLPTFIPQPSSLLRQGCGGQAFIIPHSSLILHHSFLIHPSTFILQPSSLNLHPSYAKASAGRPSSLIIHHS